MKLGFSLDKYVYLNGKKYKVDVRFRNVMRAMALLKDSGISERARVGMGVKLLLLYTDREVVSTSILQMRSIHLQTGFNGILMYDGGDKYFISMRGAVLGTPLYI